MSKSHSKLKVIRAFDRMEMLETKVVGTRFPVHFHETFVIQLIRSGVDWCCVNDLVASQGEVFLHFPNAAHTGGTVQDGSLEYQAIYPSRKLFEDLTGVSSSILGTGSWSIGPSARVCRSVGKLFSDLNSDLNSDSSETRLRRKMKEVFLLILAETNTGQSEVEHDSQSIDEKLDLAKDFLINNAAIDVSIEELSEHCDISKFHLIRTFKVRFGITPRQFLISQRVSLAKRLMIAGLPLAQAALSAGFNDQSHLARCFKKLTNFSPGQFRSASQVRI